MDVLPPVDALSDSGSDQEEDIVDTEPNTGASQKVLKLHVKRRWTTKGKNKTGKLPPHGLITVSKNLVQANIPPGKVAPLNMKCVSRQAADKKPNGAEIWRGSRTFSAYGTIRCYSACTVVTQTECSVRGSTDLANQIWHWDQYQRTMRDLNTDVNEMRYLSVAAGEYLSGLPLGWTSPQTTLDPDVLKKMFPQQLQGLKKIPCISLFSGVGGLDAGLSPRKCSSHQRSDDQCFGVTRHKHLEDVFRAGYLAHADSFIVTYFHLEQGSLPNIRRCCFLMGPTETATERRNGILFKNCCTWPEGVVIENLGLLGDRTTTNVGVFASSFEMVGNTIVVVPSQTLGLEDEPKRRLDEEGKVIGVEICAAKYFALIRGDHLRLRERVEGSTQEEPDAERLLTHLET